jgi:glycosyltransferase involved in cell wall biosynthesis
MLEEKVFYIIDTLSTGGAETSILHICKRFRYFTPYIIVIFKKDHHLLDQYEQAGIQVIQLNIDPANRLWWWKAKKKLDQLIEIHKPTIVHGHLYNGELLARLAKKNGFVLMGAFISDPYGTERLHGQPLLFKAKVKAYQILDQITAKNVDHFTCLTKTIASTNAELLSVPLDKIHVIYRGRPVSDYEVHHPSLDASTFSFLCVARLFKRKGLIDLLQAAALLKSNGKDFIIRFAGDGADVDEIKAAAEKFEINDVVEFLGTRHDVPQLLKHHHCFVLPSHYEGQGGAVIEAMLAAKPIIITNIPVFAEQVENGKSGLLFEIMNPEDLASKMQWVMEHYEESIAMGFEARKFALKHFDIDKVAAQYEELYTNILYTQPHQLLPE